MSRSHSNSSHTPEHSLSGEKLSLLAVFAHPKDESFGPAGTLAKYASEGVQVSLVTMTRAAMEGPADSGTLRADGCSDPARDRSCSCRTSGVRRVCFFDYPPGELEKIDPEIIEDQLVRLVREIQPQVVITFGPNGFSENSDHRAVNRVTTAAFRDAGDPSKFQHHFREGLGAYAPQKLYYCVLPSSLVSRWQVLELAAVPDDQITTVLDVSSHSEAMNKTVYCQRSHSLDFIRWLTEERRVQWDAEYYALVESSLNKKPRHEKDLFAGLR